MLRDVVSRTEGSELTAETKFSTRTHRASISLLAPSACAHAWSDVARHHPSLLTLRRTESPRPSVWQGYGTERPRCCFVVAGGRRVNSSNGGQEGQGDGLEAVLSQIRTAKATPDTAESRNTLSDALGDVRNAVVAASAAAIGESGLNELRIPGGRRRAPV